MSFFFHPNFTTFLEKKKKRKSENTKICANKFATLKESETTKKENTTKRNKKGETKPETAVNFHLCPIQLFHFISFLMRRATSLTLKMLLLQKFDAKNFHCKNLEEEEEIKNFKNEHNSNRSQNEKKQKNTKMPLFSYAHEFMSAI